MPKKVKQHKVHEVQSRLVAGNGGKETRQEAKPKS